MKIPLEKKNPTPDSSLWVEKGRCGKTTAIHSQALPDVVKTGRYAVLLSADFRWIATGLVLLVAAAIASPALGQTANLNVSAQVQASCNVIGGDLDFGLYTGDATEGQGSFSYQCTNGTNITLSLGPGQHLQPGGSRAMTGNGGTLRYQLFRDANRQQVWREGPEEGLDVDDTEASEQDVPVYGLIEAGQDVPAGSYNDVVLITLNIQ
jgi:spore coat protein U-like protein